jgi:hypothetical protein
MVFKHSVRTAKKTQHFTITKINWLTLFKEITAVHCENHMKNINLNAEVLVIKAGTVTTGLDRVNVILPCHSWSSRRVSSKTFPHKIPYAFLISPIRVSCAAHRKLTIQILCVQSRPALGPTQPPVQWVPGVLSPGIKRGRGVTLTTHPHLVPRLRISRIYTSSPPKRLHVVWRDSFTFLPIQIRDL